MDEPPHENGAAGVSTTAASTRAGVPQAVFPHILDPFMAAVALLKRAAGAAQPSGARVISSVNSRDITRSRSSTS
jgi:UDP:flavonoid glycosyltransferase YjiC (YdhE family)